MVVPAGAFLCLSGVLFSVFTQFLFLCFEIKRKCAFKLQWKCPQLQTTANWPDGRLISSSRWTVPVFFFSTSVLPCRYLHCFGAESCTFCTENLLAFFNLFCTFSFFLFCVCCLFSFILQFYSAFFLSNSNRFCLPLQSDFGQYNCSVWNQYGFQSQIITLQQQGKFLTLL